MTAQQILQFDLKAREIQQVCARPEIYKQVDITRVVVTACDAATTWTLETRCARASARTWSR